MSIAFKKYFFFVSFIFCCIALSAQDNDDKTMRGTIKVEKTGHLAKIVYDDVNYRLVGIDQYGNVLDSAVQSFTVKVTIKGIFTEDKVRGSFLSPKIQQILGKRDANGKIFFEDIKAKDRSGTVVDMPKMNCQVGFLREDGE